MALTPQQINALAQGQAVQYQYNGQNYIVNRQPNGIVCVNNQNQPNNTVCQAVVAELNQVQGVHFDPPAQGSGQAAGNFNGFQLNNQNNQNNQNNLNNQNNQNNQNNLNNQNNQNNQNNPNNPNNQNNQNNLNNQNFFRPPPINQLNQQVANQQQQNAGQQGQNLPGGAQPPVCASTGIDFKKEATLAPVMQLVRSKKWTVQENPQEQTTVITVNPTSNAQIIINKKTNIVSGDVSAVTEMAEMLAKIPGTSGMTISHKTNDINVLVKFAEALLNKGKLFEVEANIDAKLPQVTQKDIYDALPVPMQTEYNKLAKAHRNEVALDQEAANPPGLGNRG